MNRPTLSKLEIQLLASLKIMNSWCLHKLEPVMSGKGEPYNALKRDMAIASLVISAATGGNEE